MTIICFSDSVNPIDCLLTRFLLHQLLIIIIWFRLTFGSQDTFSNQPFTWDGEDQSFISMTLNFDAFLLSVSLPVLETSLVICHLHQRKASYRFFRSREVISYQSSNLHLMSAISLYCLSGFQIVLSYQLSII